MIKRLWHWGVNKFINKKFLTFACIGVLNTLIHIGTLYLMYKLFEALNFLQEERFSTPKILIANTISFIVASVFSYFANNRFTFGNKKENIKEFVETIIVFLARLGLTQLLTFGFVSIFKVCNLGYIWQEYVGPFTASAIMIPVTYLVLDKVLGHKKEEEKIEEE